jgi:hypothetical protein
MIKMKNKNEFNFNEEDWLIEVFYYQKLYDLLCKMFGEDDDILVDERLANFMLKKPSLAIKMITKNNIKNSFYDGQLENEENKPLIDENFMLSEYEKLKKSKNQTISISKEEIDSLIKYYNEKITPIDTIIKINIISNLGSGLYSLNLIFSIILFLSLMIYLLLLFT